MKKQFSIVISVFLMLLLSSCFNAADKKSSSSGSASSNPTHATRYADLNHDGTDDYITVDLTGEHVKTFMVFDGVNDKTMIWSGNADIPHAGWDGWYLYEEDGKQYLLNWHPYMNHGYGNYSYEIFHIDDNHEKAVLRSENVGFSLDDLDSVPEARAFVERANEYLAKSIVLIDTNDGEVTFSTTDNPVTKTYDISWWDSHI